MDEGTARGMRMQRSLKDIQGEARAIHALLGGPSAFDMEPIISSTTRPKPISVKTYIYVRDYYIEGVKVAHCADLFMRYEDNTPKGLGVDFIERKGQLITELSAYPELQAAMIAANRTRLSE